MNIQRAYVEITNLCNLHCDFCAGHHRPISGADRRVRLSAKERRAASAGNDGSPIRFQSLCRLPKMRSEFSYKIAESIRIYKSIPSRISLRPTNSSALCDRALSPTPSFSDGMSSRAWSEVVGDP